ncbi:MAG: uracil-DNA glycosylase family protein [Candidatus Spyradenecus sp.]
MQDSDFADHPLVAALSEAIDTLTCLRETGVKQVPIDAAVWQAFCAAPASAAKAAAPVAVGAMPKIPAPAQVQGARPTPGGNDTPEQRERVLEALCREIASCKGCAYGANGHFGARGNGYNPAVAIVAAPPVMGEDAAAQGARLEEGSAAWALLEKMFAAIRLPMSELYVTPAMKCGVPRGRVEAAALRTCGELLKRELRAVNPRVVVLLGPVAAQALFPESTASAGQVGQWRMLREGHVPVMTLHHPMRMLMLGEEMSRKLKVENWEALKSVQARLAQGR